MILGDEGRAECPQKTFEPETLDHAAPELDIGFRLDYRRRDPIRMLDDPVRNLDTAPEVISLPGRPFDRRSILAVQLPGGQAVDDP